MDYSVLRQSDLFLGLDDKQINYALSFFNAKEAYFEKDAFLQHTGGNLKQFGLVLSGKVEVFMDDIDGNQMLLANVTAGETFGESLCYLQIAEIPVYIRAAEDCSLLWLDCRSIQQLCNNCNALDFVLTDRFISMLARRTLSMNDRIQILSKPTLRTKLLTFLSQCEHRYGSKTFSIPFDRSKLAVYLGANRSAMTRELAAMKKEGIIDFYRNTFRLL